MTRIFDADADRDALPAGVAAALEQALRHAWAPAELDPKRHEQILELVLEDPFAQATPEEIVASERLRRALDGGAEHPDLALARALSVAHARRDAPPELLQRAAERSVFARRKRALYVAFGSMSTLAAAAGFVLFLMARAEPMPAAIQDRALLQSRPSAPLFQGGTPGSTTDRIDRIAELRARELRSNRYALWGVR